MAPTRVACIDCSPYMRGLLSLELAGMLPGLVVHQGIVSGEQLIDRLRDVIVVINGWTPMSADVLRRCPHLRSIVFLGTGASSYVDLAAAAELGIRIRTVKGYGDRAVAEHTFALLLAAARQVAAMDRAVRQGRWEALAGVELTGRRLGVVGTGGIGREVIRIAHAFGMEVLAWNRSRFPADLPCRTLSLDALLAASDVVSLHVSLTLETHNLIDARRLALMKPQAILVNTSRGGVVDEAALVAALEAKRIGHAALDVFVEEPLPPDHALTRLANVTLTAHAGYRTPEASRRLLAIGLDLARRDLAAFSR